MAKDGTKGSSEQRWVACPRCRQKALYGPTNPARPFCSPRCRSLDLGAWASEGYRVASAPAEADPDAPQPDSGAAH